MTAAANAGALRPRPREIVPDLDIRPSCPADMGAMQEFVAGLSAETAYRRFLAPVPRLTLTHAAAMVDVDHWRDETLLAVPRGGASGIVAVAQYVRTGAVTAEMAIVVADSWQRRGVGTVLLRRLVDLAADRHYQVLAGDYLSENRGIVRLVSRMPGSLTVRSEGPTSVMTLQLDLRAGSRLSGALAA